MACRTFIRPGSLSFVSIRASSASQSAGLTGIARSRYFVHAVELPSHQDLGQPEVAGPVAPYPQQPAEVERLLAGERRQLDDAGDQVGRGRRRDGRGAAADRVADDHGRTAEVAHHGDQVAGDVGAAVAVPAEAGVAAAADVDVGDAVAGRDQGRGEETVGVPAVADAVREDDEGTRRRSGRRRCVPAPMVRCSVMGGASRGYGAICDAVRGRPSSIPAGRHQRDAGSW